MISGVAAWAQAPADSPARLDLALTYSATLSNAVNSDQFWLQGGTLQLQGHIGKGWSVVADAAGGHTSSVQSSGVALDLFTITFGPRYTWRPAHKRCELFGQVLLGEASGENSLFPHAIGPTDNASSAALLLGGGLNMPLRRRFTFRLLDADWLRTTLPNSTTNVQNTLRIGAGVQVKIR
jgi:hypothetical protein